MSTKIDWCDEVWNPTTGCTKGCTYCYARPIANMRMDHPNPKIATAYRFGFHPTCHEGRLNIPMKWKKPRRVFVDSMGDLFDPGIPFRFIDKVMTAIHLYEQHTFLLLTKQPQRMRGYFETLYTPPLFGTNDRFENLWLGVSVTCQKEFDIMLPLLLLTPAARRFLSIEPVHGAIDIGGSIQGLDWVICGGENGPKANPLDHEWVIGLRDQCQAGGVPFFFKGWGKWRPGAQIDGREWKEFPA